MSVCYVFAPTGTRVKDTSMRPTGSMRAPGLVVVLPSAFVVVWFLATTATYYVPGFGFTRLIGMAAGEQELAAVRAVPHYTMPGGYDGQFYAELAVDPLLKDPAIDRALDAPAFRARRILPAWTAYVLGLGRPAWILQAFALQNVVVWLLLAWLLLRWFPTGSWRSCVLWSGCLLTHGLLCSVQYALADGPTCLLIAGVVVFAERGHPWLSALVTGAAGLSRETGLLAGAALAPLLAGGRRRWLQLAGCAVVAALPLALWLDYLYAIYRGDTWTGGDHIVVPFTGMIAKVEHLSRAVITGAPVLPTMESTLVIVAFLTQMTYVTWRVIRTRALSPWLSVALSFGLLGIVSNYAVWEGTPGAITRISLPLAIGFNVAAVTAPWAVVLLGNLGVVAGVIAFTTG